MSDREDFEKWAVSEGFDLTEDDVDSVRIAFLAGRKPPKGWKLVPIKATALMRIAARAVGGARFPGQCWSAMLSAAPERE